jgi:hypothetical protein
VAPLTTYDETVLRDLPSNGSFWKLNEGAGAFGDSGGGAHSGTAVGTPTYAQPGPGGLSSRIFPNFAVRFAADSNQGIDFGDVYEFTGTQSFSLELWVYPTARAAQLNCFLMNQEVVGADGWDLRILAARTLRFSRIQASASEQTTSTSLVTMNVWSHVVVTYDGMVRIYLNGSPVCAPKVSTNSIQANAATLIVGKYSGTGNSLDGLIARPAVYPSVALSAQQVFDHYAVGHLVGNAFE